MWLAPVESHTFQGVMPSSVFPSLIALALWYFLAWHLSSFSDAVQDAHGYILRTTQYKTGELSRDPTTASLFHSSTYEDLCGFFGAIFFFFGFCFAALGCGTQDF